MTALFDGLLRLGDSTLILSHRVSEWCGVAPALEEDIALANTALDLIGQAQMWLGLAADVEGRGRSADDLAFLRDVWEFRNVLLVERPNGDFGHTIMRQFLFDQQNSLMLNHLRGSSDERVAAIAQKAAKEAAYHVERSTDLVIALGDGSDESHRRMQTALDALWPYVREMFQADDVDAELVALQIMPNPTALRAEWDARVDAAFTSATLIRPDDNFAHKGGKSGRHTEHLGHLLTSMQWLQRAYPGAKW